MILPLLSQAQEVAEELLDAPKLRKEKKRKKLPVWRRSGPRNVRPGETRNQSTAWSESFKICMDSMPGFPIATSLFLWMSAARVHFSLRPACCGASHNQTLADRALARAPAKCKQNGPLVQIRTCIRVRQTPTVLRVRSSFGRAGRTYDGAETGDNRQTEPEIKRCGPSSIRADACIIHVRPSSKIKWS